MPLPFAAAERTRVRSLPLAFIFAFPCVFMAFAFIFAEGASSPANSSPANASRFRAGIQTGRERRRVLRLGNADAEGKERERSGARAEIVPLSTTSNSSTLVTCGANSRHGIRARQPIDNVFSLERSNRLECARRL
ncbi:hypothetical protein DFH08DRAFT_876377 [Mycena albidolilacea]|uniref:Transmembrane protein n=1 Tax=Mycena albidolilacea TaxID=1033008 RepID=A0AAD6ZTT5_9AGAR|nr:hypothetical protein DFH08DRAFT_876377 [Mycena albidolilacea]